jgi:glutathione S-transferase
MKLFGSPTSPFVRKALIWADELGLKDQIEMVQTAVSPGEVNSEYALKNPLVQVPALETDTGLMLSDSTAICDHIGRKAGVYLFPESGEERDRALQDFAICNGATEALVQCAYETIKRPPELKWDAYIAGRMAKVTAALQAIETGEHGFLELGETPTYGQVTLICLIGYANFRFPELNVLDHPRIAAFYAATHDRASVVATTPR